MGQIYYADDITNPAPSSPSADTITRHFIFTAATALTASGAAALLVGDFVCLAPIPGGAMLQNYQINVPDWDTGSTALTLDVGDNLILSGATNLTVSTTAFTTPVFGTSFTLTASASTSSFTATNGLLMVGNVLVGYASLSGSTFVTCYSGSPSTYVPAGSLIQQAGNTAVYASTVAMVSSATNIINPGFSIQGTTIVSATSKPAAIPAFYPVPWNTVPLTNPAVPQNMSQTYFMLKIHASAGTWASGTLPLTGFIQYTMRGNAS